MGETLGYIPPEALQEVEKKEASFAETVKFIKENWKRFFHIHPRERGTLIQVTPEEDIEDVEHIKEATQFSLAPQYLGLSEAALPPHERKAYPEEKVLPYLTEEFKKYGLSPENAETRARLLEYHTPVDVEKTHEIAEKEAAQYGKEFLRGAEVDVVVKLDSQGQPEISLRTPEEILRQENLNYMIVSLHPETDPVLQEIANNNPEALLEVYKQICRRNSREKREKSGLPSLVLGHPGRRCPAFLEWSSVQKEEFVQVAKEFDVPLEISTNDYYFTPSRYQPPAEREKFMREKIRMMDPEILALIAKYKAPIVIETDLHYGDWAKKFRTETANPLELILENIREKGFLEMYHQALRIYKEELPEEKRRKLAKELPVMIGNFVRVVQRIRGAGITDEQILNTVGKDELPL